MLVVLTQPARVNMDIKDKAFMLAIAYAAHSLEGETCAEFLVRVSASESDFLGLLQKASKSAHDESSKAFWNNMKS